MRVQNQPYSRHAGAGASQPGRLALGGLAAVLIGLAAGCGDAPTAPLLEPPTPSFAVATSSFSEPFDAWNTALWSQGDHVLGRGYLDPNNVALDNGALVIGTPTGTFDGGEILSTSQYGYGTYTASMRCGTPRGTVCAFFLYQGVRGKQNDEVDIELLGSSSTIYFTTWVRGRRTNHVELTLPFDPGSTYHTYSIEYRASAVTFRVDGQILKAFTRKLPTQPSSRSRAK